MATIIATASGGTRNWSDTATWVGGVVPGNTSDVKLDATSGNVIVNGTRACRSLDCTGYTGTLSASGVPVLNIGDATAGTGNIALKFSTGMVFTGGTTLNFVSTSATQQTIDYAGRFTASVTFNGAGGSWLYLSDHTAPSSVCTLSAGTLNTNGFACAWVSFISTTGNTRTLTLGASAITITGGSIAWNVTSTITINSGTSVIEMIANTVTFAGGAKSYYTLIFSTGTGNKTLAANNTFVNLTFTAVAPDQGFIFTATTTQTVTGTLTATGIGANSRGMFRSTSDGTGYTINLSTAGTTSITNMSFMDATFVGTNTPITGSRLGDGNGNSGITFQAPTPRYWVGNAAGEGISDSGGGRWANSSGGSTSVNNFPLPQDDMIWDANSFSADGQTVIFDRVFLGHDWDVSALDQTVTFQMTTIYYVIYGDLRWSPKATATTTCNVWMEGDAGTIACNGGSLGSIQPLQGIRIAAGRTMDLADDYLANSTAAFVPGNAGGTFNTNDHNISVGFFNSTNAQPRTLNLGSSQISVTGTGTVWNMGTGSLLTLNAGTSVIRIDDNTGTAKTFVGAGKTYYILGVHRGSGNSATITGSNTFERIAPTNVGPLTIAFTAGTTTTLTGGDDAFPSGFAGNVVMVQSSAAGSAFTVTKASGTATAHFVSLKDSTATGGATWRAFNSSVVSNVSGWAFLTPTPNITTGPSATKISRVSSKDVTTFGFTADADFQAYKLKVVPGSGSPDTAGTLIESGGVGYHDVESVVDVTDDELVAASGAEGSNIIKAFVQDYNGAWSA